MALGHASDQRQEVLGNVPGAGLSLDRGGEIVSGVFEALGRNGADEEIEVLDGFLDEPFATIFESQQAGHGEERIKKDRRVYAPITSAVLLRGKHFFSQIAVYAPKRAKLLHADQYVDGVSPRC